MSSKSVIWKFQLQPGGTRIELPRFHKILTAQTQQTGQHPDDQEIFVWILLDPEQPKETSYHFEVVPTGLVIEGFVGTYLSTVQMMNGVLVFHIFYEEV